MSTDETTIEGAIPRSLVDMVDPTEDFVGLWPFDGSNIADSPVVKKVASVVKEGVTVVVKHPGVLNMAWVADAIARKIPGYEKLRAAIPLGAKTAELADAMHKAGNGEYGAAIAQAAQSHALKEHVALAIPAAAPLVAQLTIAGRMVDVVDGKRGTPEQQAKMRDAMHLTSIIARIPAAERTAEQAQIARTAQLVALADYIKRRVRSARAGRASPRLGVFVDPTGHVTRGHFVKV
jgi:hypothetical protein